MSEAGWPRPSANPHLFGHERAEALLVRAWCRGRLPHAWLLRGPQGVGKATLAYRFARRLLAGPRDHEAAAADPGHPVFRMVANGAHPDLRVLDRAANRRTGRLARDITVEQVREADNALHATAARGGARVLIVDEADALNASSANALLKLVEEPPQGVILLFVCQRRGLLPATIVSRCAQLALGPLPEALLARSLGVLAPDLPRERARLLAGQAGGSPGRAIAIEAGGWLEAYGDLLAELAAARDREAARLQAATQLAARAERGGFSDAADLLALVLRRLARLEAGRPPSVELVPDELRLLATIAAGRGLDRWVALWEKLTTLARGVETVNLDPFSALLQLVQGVSGVEPRSELGIG